MNIEFRIVTIGSRVRHRRAGIRPVVAHGGPSLARRRPPLTRPGQVTPAWCWASSYSRWISIRSSSVNALTLSPALCAFARTRARQGAGCSDMMPRRVVNWGDGVAER